MKILLATGIFPPDIGGPAIYTEKMALELWERGIEVKIITYSDGGILKSQISNPLDAKQTPRRVAFQTNSKWGPAEGWEGGGRVGVQIPNSKVQVQRVSRRYPKGLRHFLYFWNGLRLAKDCDIIYAQNLFSAGLPSLLAAKILGKKIVVKIVGDWVWERFASSDETIDDFQKKKQGWKIGFLRKLQTYLARRANKIITPSYYLKRIVSGWGVLPEKIEVIYNAAPDFPEPNFSKEEAKRRIGISGTVLLSIGRFVPWKGFSALIEIMPELLKENPDFSLVIIGEGPERKNLKSKISRHKLKKEVKLIGKIDHQAMPLYFKATDLFVSNSGYEGLSHVILEAMQMAVPIITTRVGGNPELIKDGENGILVDYNNKNQLKEAIIRLSKDKSGQERLIKNSQEKVKEFNWQRLIENTLEVLISPAKSGYSTSGVE